MLSSAIRVIARTAAIQLEEVAAAHAVHQPRSTFKGQGQELRHDSDVVARSEGYAAQQSGQRSVAQASDVSGMRVEEEAETSEEVRAVERKIAKLLERAKMREREMSAATAGAGTSAPIVKEEHLLAEKQLSEEARAPKTIQGHHPHSSTTETSATTSDHLPAQLSEAVRKPKTIQPRSTPPPTSQYPVSPENDAPPAEVRPTDAVTTPASVASSSTATPSPPPATEQEAIVPPKVESEVLDALENASEEETPVMLRASKVPSSRIGRLFHYGSLAASMSLGAASESIRRSTGCGGTGNVFMSDANIRRLVATLGRMRGAALKLGQFMSIQDNHMLPPEIEKVLQQVQAHANYMPDWQMDKVLSEELGADWQSLFSSFDRTPIASASIGQVHRATLTTDETVAVKIQFPGIKESIASDLGNLSLLLRSSALLPPGLYLQNTIAVMRRELEDECDYIREGESGSRFYEMLKGDEFFEVPRVFEQATRGRVLTSEWMSGRPLSRMKGMSQETRDKIGTNILRLCLQELFHFRFMQTDPNWANFLYDEKSDKIQLIDFGASREYTKEFMDGWFRLLRAALEGDKGSMKHESEALGYLTGEENDEMLQAHLESMRLVASPFSHSGPYDFSHQTITDSVRALIPIMLKHRLTPPPQETYSLNRKLSGAFLMCARLGARVDCRRLWDENVRGYKEG